jgi:hypothetical protein
VAAHLPPPARFQKSCWEGPGRPPVQPDAPKLAHIRKRLARLRIGKPSIAGDYGSPRLSHMVQAVCAVDDDEVGRSGSGSRMRPNAS